MKVRLGWALVACGAAALLVASLSRGVDQIHASRVLMAVEARTGLAIRMGDRGTPVVIENVALLRRVAPRDPLEVGLPVALAGQYLLLQRWDSAIATYDAALALEPRPETYLNRGRALLGAGRPAEAVDDFERAVLLAPFLSAAVPPSQHAEVVRRVRAKTGWALR